MRDFVRRYFEFRRRVRAGEEMDVMIFGDMRSLTEQHASEVWPKYVDLFRSVRGIVADPERGREASSARECARAPPDLATDPLGVLAARLSRRMNSTAWRRVSPTSCSTALPRRADATRSVASIELSEKAPPDKRSWESFLLAATRLINQQGYRGASVERIARQINAPRDRSITTSTGRATLVVACFNRNHAPAAGGPAPGRRAGEARASTRLSPPRLRWCAGSRRRLGRCCATRR